MRVRGRLLLLCGIFVFATIANAFQAAPLSAAQITNRSLTLQPEGTTGGSTPGGVVNHLFLVIRYWKHSTALGLFELYSFLDLISKMGH